MYLYTKILSSGQFVVAPKSRNMLKAHLGSCVGVAIVDRSAGICGMLHVLLPEPTGDYVDENAGFYATVGMEAFYKALLEKGANPRNMAATVAGGALIGSVSKMDMDLDIGGRSADQINLFLAKHHIKIEQSETGGYLSMTLTLNLHTLQCTIESTCTTGLQAERLNSNFRPEDIEEAIRKVLPIPQIALKVIRMIQADNISMTQIAGEIRQDGVLSASIIRLSNSVFVSSRHRVQTIDEALVYLGEKRLLFMTLSMFTEQYYQKANASGYSLCKGGLYYHTLGTALIAEYLADVTKTVSAGLAYTAGLLHDIGKSVLDQFVAEDLPFLYRKLHNSGATSLVNVERQIFGIDHTQTGFRLARNWDLPDALSETIGNHHQPAKARINPPLTALVYLADVLMNQFRAGFVPEGYNSENIGLCLETLKIRKQDLPVIIDNIPWEMMDVYGIA